MTMRRALRLAAWLALALMLIVTLWCTLAWWVLPPWLKSRAETALADSFGRPARIAAVRIAPWPPALEVDGIEVASRHAGRPPLLRIERLRALASATSVVERALVLEAIAVDSAQVTIERSARAQWDIDDLVAAWHAPAGDRKNALPRVVVHRFDASNGKLAVDDRFAGRRHAIDAFTLSVTDLSTRAEDADQALKATLALRLNGSALKADGEATPWAATRRLDWRTAIEALDVAAFRADLDTLLPLRLQSACLSVSIDGHYARAGSAAATLDLRGQASLADIGLRYPDGSIALQGRALHVQIGSLRPLEQQVRIDRVRLDGFALPLVRDAQGKLNIAALAAVAPQADPPGAPGAPAAAAAPSWRVALHELELDDTTIGFRDLGTTPATALKLTGLELRASDIRLPPAGPVTVRAQAQLRHAEAAPSGHLLIDGKVGSATASIHAKLDDFALGALQPYLSAWLVPRVERGTAQVEGRIEWAAEPTENLRLVLDKVQVDKLAIGDASWRSFTATGLTLDLAAREVHLAGLHVDQPALRLARDAQGRVNLATWLRAAPATAAPGVAAAGRSKPDSSRPPPWRLWVDQAVIAGGRLDFADAMSARAGVEDAFALRIEDLALRARDLRWPAGATPTPIRLRGRIVVPGEAAPAAVERRFAVRGEARLAPLAWKGAVEIVRAPLHAFDRYAPLPATQHLLGANASLRAQLDLLQTALGWCVAGDGNASLADLRIAERGDGTDADLLGWRLLAADAMRLRLVPAERPRLAIGELQLTGVDGRLVVTEQGELKLGTIGARTTQPPPAAPTPAAPPEDDLGKLDLEIGSTRLVDGKIDFADYFIRPNYRAELTALNGQLGAVRSSGGEAAPLVVGGVVAGSGRLEVSGSLNPTTRPLALNLRARASDIELPPLSAYSGKYAGYDIAEGTLSVDVSYRVDPDGKLEAKNRIVLNRLTFGEPVESPAATKLPVRFLVALLKDRNGVIDINLPIEGSINAPEFRLGPLIVEVLVKLLTRAVASPFAALAGEDGDQLGVIGFEAGTATFSADAGKVLDRVSAMLDSRPALTLQIVGTADPQSEAEAFRRAALEARLQALHAPAGGSPPMGEQREQLLRQLYRQSDLPDRPRNLIGRLADVPVAEMVARLRASIVVADDAMRDLALQRGLAVRSALLGRATASERLFVGTPVLRQPDDAGWTPRARLSLLADGAPSGPKAAAAESPSPPSVIERRKPR